MSGLLSAWRKFGATIVALALAMLVIGPSMDGVICFKDVSAKTAAYSASVDAATSDGAPDSSKNDVASCIHGHCHHGGVFAPAADVVAVAFSPPSDAHNLHRLRIATSDLKFDLDRPPRA